MDPRLKFPSVIIEGPRSSGKLTWLKSQIPMVQGPDYIELFQEDHYKLEDFEEIWPILPVPALMSDFRAIVIRRAENVSAVIFNKLLKILEETKINRFYFLTTNRSSILPTIQSRSVLIRRPSNADDSRYEPIPIQPGVLTELLNKDGDPDTLRRLQLSLSRLDFADVILDIERTFQSINPNIKLAMRHHVAQILTQLTTNKGNP